MSPLCANAARQTGGLKEQEISQPCGQRSDTILTSDKGGRIAVINLQLRSQHSWCTSSGMNRPKLNALIALFDIVGLTAAIAMLAWHFLLAELPQWLLWGVAAPLLGICAVGRAKALIRYLRARPQGK